MKTRRGFTLVELLTVIVIILMLAGITMKLMALVTRKTGIARASGDIERIKNALTEYHAVYGCYPPVGRMDRQFENPNEALRPKSPPKDGAGYYDGLTTYLFADAQSDRWSKYLDGWPDSDDKPMSGYNPLSGTLSWSNRFQTIYDPWVHSYLYNSGPPYQAFILYSAGPDGVAGTADDVGSKWME